MDIATEPGTEIKVTPDIAALIIAVAVTHHDIRRLPEKYPALSTLRSAINATAKRIAMYIEMVAMMINGLTLNALLCKIGYIHHAVRIVVILACVMFEPKLREEGVTLCFGIVLPGL